MGMMDMDVEIAMDTVVDIDTDEEATHVHDCC